MDEDKFFKRLLSKNGKRHVHLEIKYVRLHIFLKSCAFDQVKHDEDSKSFMKNFLVVFLNFSKA